MLAQLKGLSIYYVIRDGGEGVFPIYYNITRGRGGSLGTPNLYYVIYGQPLQLRKHQLVIKPCAVTA